MPRRSKLCRAEPLVAKARRGLVISIGLALFGGAAVVRRAYHVPLGDGLDGAYYYQIARHVARGEGLVTSYSVFHMGLSPLPRATNTYPLLPYLIGYLGHAVPLELAAVWLPGVCYVLSVSLCFAFLLWQTARSLPREHFHSRLTLCALLAAWFALVPDYVWTSARPYTDTLGTLLVLTTLYAFGVVNTALFRTRGRRRAAFFFVGMLSGLCYLARFQLIVVGLSLVSARLLGGGRRARRDAAFLALGALPCLVGQALRLFSLPNAEALALIDFAKYRQLPELPPFRYTREFASKSAWLFDKLGGVLVSFDPRSEESYLAQHGYLAWLVPLGFALFVLEAARDAFHPRLSRPSFRKIRRPRHAALVASAWVGLLAVAPIHTVHSFRWPSWAFGWRQGLPITFLILPVTLWLWSRHQAALRVIVAAALAVSLVIGARNTRALVAHRVSPSMTDGYAAVGAYLERIKPHTGTLGMEHQGLAVFTDAPLYWLACWSPPGFANTLLREIPIQRILLRPGELNCPSLVGIRSRLHLERTFLDHFPMAVYEISAAPGPRDEARRK